PNLKRHLDLIALGTIADVAPLTGENHILVRSGLEVAHKTEKPGLSALKEVSGVTGKIDPVAVGFGLGPRLNAAGRMGKADTGFHLLTTKDSAEASELARQLDSANDERRELQKSDVEEAESIVHNLIMNWRVIYPDSILVMEAIQGWRKHQFSFWDAFIWASAKKARTQRLYSEDFQHKQIVEGVQFVNPFIAGNEGIICG
ncbi:hypothetical protein CO110_09010, partial [Candidatus Desantisbacteria bacterium CG_4_9_14_3_um_filter_40_11]